MKLAKLPYEELVLTINHLLTSTKQKLESSVNSTMILTYWSIGKYIVEFEKNGKERAEYGTALLKKLSKDLTKSFGNGYSWRNLYNMVLFYNQYPILQTLYAKSGIEIKSKETIISGKLSTKIRSSILKLNWSHFVRLISIKNEEERNFYIIETAENSWSVRELNRQINASLFERLILHKDKKSIKKLAQNGNQIKTHQDFLKDPLVLEFLNIKEDKKYSENELESAIIDNLGDFLLELGKGFTFVARQKRISSGSDHFYIDLVFYNRILRSFILIDLKIGKLKHQDIGQMQMYVNYFDREIKEDNENPTIGIILCKEKDDFIIEFTLPKSNNQIFTKEYKLYLPDKKELQKILEHYL